MAIAEALDHGELLVHALSCQYATLYWQGCMTEAIEVARRGREAAHRVGNMHNVAVFEGHRSMIAWAQRDYGEALEAARESYRLYDAIDEALGRAIAGYGLGNLYMETGRLDTALGVLTAALEGYRALGQRIVEARVLSTLAALHRMRGEPAEAQACIEQGVAVAREVESEGALADLEAVAGKLAFDAGRLEEAGACFRSVLRTFEEQGLTSYLPFVRAWLAQTLAQDGRVAEAMATAREAWTSLQEDEGPEEVEEALWNLVCAARACHASEEAATWLEQAHARLSSFAASLGEADRRDYETAVPAVRALHEAWAAARPTRLTVELPRAVEGMAQPDDERGRTVTVTWTVAAPEDDAIAERVARRRHRLARLRAEAAAQGARAGAEVLAVTLGVSRRTIERDLRAEEGNNRPTGV